MVKIVNDVIHLNDAIQQMVNVKNKDLLESEFYGDIRLKFKKGMLVQFIKEESITLEDN